MTILETLLEEVDKLSPSELRELRRFIETKHRHQVWIVPEKSITQLEEILKPIHEIADKLSEEEINAIIDEAIEICSSSIPMARLKS